MLAVSQTGEPRGLENLVTFGPGQNTRAVQVRTRFITLHLLEAFFFLISSKYCQQVDNRFQFS